MLSPMIFVLSALSVVAWRSVRRIPEGHAYSLRRVDGHTRVVGAGTHLVFPLIERVEHKICLTGNMLELKEISANGHVCQGSIYFQVLDPEQADAVIDLLPKLVQTNITALLSQPTLPNDLPERRQWVKQGLNAELRQYGLLITRTELTFID